VGDELAVLVVRVGLLAEQLDPLGEIDDRVGSSGLVEVAGGEAVEEEVSCLSGCSSGPARS
jgi:hypothetical protein